jgi:hypothetical protein
MKGDTMHRVHVPRVAAPAPARPRGAKVISLDARRKARLERIDPKRPAPRPAA